MDPHTLHRGTCLSVKSPVSFWEGSEDDGENEEQSAAWLRETTGLRDYDNHCDRHHGATKPHIVKHVVVPLHWLGSL